MDILLLLREDAFDLRWRMEKDVTKPFNKSFNKQKDALESCRFTTA